MAIDTSTKRSALMMMGTPHGTMLTYSDGTSTLSNIIERLGMLYIGYFEDILYTISVLDIEHTFEITRLITCSFNINKIISDTFKTTPDG